LPRQQSGGDSTNSDKPAAVNKYPISALLSPAALLTYACNSADNFTKYSVNAWAATMLFEKFDASPTTIGAILATQEAVGVASRVLVGLNKASGTAPFRSRGFASAIAFSIQGVAQLAAFQASSHHMAAIMFVIAAAGTGGHSIGFRPMYFEVSPEHAGTVSGFGNTVASLASAIGPAAIGSMQSWNEVGVLLLLINLGGILAALIIMQLGRQAIRRTVCTKKVSDL
jgi:sugar phosphate permease